MSNTSTVSHAKLINTNVLNVNKQSCFKGPVRFTGNGGCGRGITLETDLVQKSGDFTVCGDLIVDTISGKNGVINFEATPCFDFDDPSCNTYWGYNVGSAVSPGTLNTGFGYNALMSVTVPNGFGNTAFGKEALKSLTTGWENVGIGYQAGKFLTGINSRRNTIIGTQALNTSTEAGAVTIVGYRAMANAIDCSIITTIGAYAMENTYYSELSTVVGYQACQNGTDYVAESTIVGYQAMNACNLSFGDVAVGAFALHKIIESDSNTAVGSHALCNLGMNGYYAQTNTALGAYAGDALVTANDNVLLGANSFGNATTGNGNIIAGVQAGDRIITGNYNIIVGYQACYNNSISTANIDQTIAIGYQSLQNISSGVVGTTVLGNQGLQSMTSGIHNTGMGYQVMQLLTTGSDNTAMGYQAGNALVSGSNNVIVGSNSDTGAAVSNSTIVGQGAIASHSDSIVLGNNASSGASNEMSLALTAVAGSSGASGNFMNIRVNGVLYKLELHTP